MKRVLCSLLAMLLLTACGYTDTTTWEEQYDIGIHYLSEGNYEEAIIAFAAAIEIDPKRADAYIGLADAYVAQGDMEQARRILEDALSVVTDADAIRNRLNRMEGNATSELSPDPAVASTASEIGSSVNFTGDLSISNLTCWGNENETELVYLSFTVNGPSQVREVHPLFAMNPTRESAERAISDILPSWAETAGRRIEAPPYEETFVVHISQKWRGTTQTFLLVGLDEELSDISYAVVTVDFP